MPTIRKRRVRHRITRRKKHTMKGGGGGNWLSSVKTDREAKQSTAPEGALNVYTKDGQLDDTVIHQDKEAIQTHLKGLNTIADFKARIGDLIGFSNSNNNNEEDSSTLALAFMKKVENALRKKAGVGEIDNLLKDSEYPLFIWYLGNLSNAPIAGDPIAGE